MIEKVNVPFLIVFEFLIAVGEYAAEISAFFNKQGPKAF